MKNLLLPLTLALFLFSCDSKNMDNEEGGKGKEPAYFTVTYHKNVKFNSAIGDPRVFGDNRILILKDEDITGEPPVDPTHYKSGDKALGQVKQSNSYGSVFESPEKGTMELEGYRLLGWARRLTDGKGMLSTTPIADYTDENPQWFLYIPRDGAEFYNHNMDFDPIWEKIFTY